MWGVGAKKQCPRKTSRREMCVLWGCGCQKVVLKGMRGPWGPLPHGTSQGDRVALGQANEGGAHGESAPPRYLMARAVDAGLGRHGAYCARKHFRMHWWLAGLPS